MSTLQITKSFGFCANIDLPTWKNATIQLVNEKCKDYFGRINNTAYHDLSKITNPTEDIGELLGLGLKICIQSRRLEKSSLTEGIVRMRRDVLLKYIFTENDEDLAATEYDYNPKLYIKSKWQPPLANKNTKMILTNFHSAV